MIGRKIQLAATVLLLNVTCFIGVFFVSAYLTDMKQAENCFTVGNNRSEIIEDYQQVTEIRPGMVIHKDVSVKNTGRNSCRVRVMVLFSDSEAGSNAEINYNLNKWELKDDGYYHYRGILPAGESTESLFTELRVSEDVRNMKGFEIYVYAESINVEAGDFSGSGNNYSNCCLCGGLSPKGSSGC